MKAVSAGVLLELAAGPVLELYTSCHFLNMYTEGVKNEHKKKKHTKWFHRSLPCTDIGFRFIYIVNATGLINGSTYPGRKTPSCLANITGRGGLRKLNRRLGAGKGCRDLVNSHLI